MFKLAFLAALALALQGQAASVSATTQIMQMNFYDGATCTGSKASVPFLVEGICTPVTAQASYKPNCATGGYDIYQTHNCTGSAITTAFACTAIPDLGAFDFGCDAYPTDKLVTVTFASSCDGTSIDEDSISNSFTFVLDQCFRMPSFGSGQTATSYRTSLGANRAISMNLYSGATCGGSAIASYTGALDGGCGTATTTGAGRLLQGGQSFTFKTAVPGASVGGSATLAVLNAAFAAVALLITSFVVMQ